MSAAAATRVLELETPEHVPVRFNLSSLSHRFVALAVDLGVVFGGVILLFVAAWFVFAGGGSSTPGALALLAIFLWRNFYFTASEVLGRGRTLGKRLLRLRVVARDGGPLETEQIFARNLTRDLELFLPLTWLLAPRELVPEAPAWVAVLTGVWVLVLALLPFTNRLRARLGDLVAGTVVVDEPTGELLQDLAGSDALRRPEYRFRREQLDIYGIHELQVLEDVLRRPPSVERSTLLHLIAEKVVAKIGWSEPVPRPASEAFLRAFYAAQRGRLEKRMLFGERRERKVR